MPVRTKAARCTKVRSIPAAASSICPLHFFRFDVRTGASVTNPELIAPTFPVTISEGDVYVDIADPRQTGDRRIDSR